MNKKRLSWPARHDTALHEENHIGFSKTLAIYIGCTFTLTTIATLLALTGLVSLFDFLDLLRRAATHPDTLFSVVFEITALHVPYYIIYILPFSILLGGIICFSRLTRSSELVVARAAGVSAWQFLSSPVFCAVTIGILIITCLSPLSSSLYRHAEILDEIWLHNGTGPMTLSHGSLWLCQSDHGLIQNGTAIIHMHNLQLEGEKLHVYGVTIFRLDPQNHPLSRIEAPEGVLYQKEWHFSNATHLIPAHLPHHMGMLSLPSELTVEWIRNSSAPPDTLSLWALPGFIHLLQHSGFPTIQHRLHLQALLALPVLAGTMALVSAGFSMRPARRGGVTRMLGAGIAAGFALFTVSKVAEQLGKSGALPPLLAAWAPAIAGLCLAATLLLYMEDG